MSKSLLENLKNYAQVYTTYMTCFARKSKFSKRKLIQTDSTFEKIP